MMGAAKNTGLALTTEGTGAKQELVRQFCDYDVKSGRRIAKHASKRVFVAGITFRSLLRIVSSIYLLLQWTWTEPEIYTQDLSQASQQLHFQCWI